MQKGKFKTIPLLNGFVKPYQSPGPAVEVDEQALNGKVGDVHPKSMVATMHTPPTTLTNGMGEARRIAPNSILN